MELEPHLRWFLERTEMESKKFRSEMRDWRKQQTKTNLPEFFGFDPQGWLQQATMYFEIHGTPSHLRIPLAQLSMKGVSQYWFSIVKQVYDSLTWEQFQFELLQRFNDLEHQELMIDRSSLATVPIPSSNSLLNRDLQSEIQDLQSVPHLVVVSSPQNFDSDFIDSYNPNCESIPLSSEEFINPSPVEHIGVSPKLRGIDLGDYNCHLSEALGNRSSPVTKQSIVHPSNEVPDLIDSQKQHVFSYGLDLEYNFSMGRFFPFGLKLGQLNSNMSAGLNEAGASFVLTEKLCCSYPLSRPTIFAPILPSPFNRISGGADSTTPEEVNCCRHRSSTIYLPMFLSISQPHVNWDPGIGLVEEKAAYSDSGNSIKNVLDTSEARVEKILINVDGIMGTQHLYRTLLTVLDQYMRYVIILGCDTGHLVTEWSNCSFGTAVLTCDAGQLAWVLRMMWLWHLLDFFNYWDTTIKHWVGQYCIFRSCDMLFVSRFWQNRIEALLSLAVGLTMKGQTDASNLGLEDYLDCLTIDQLHLCCLWLSWTKFGTSSSSHGFSGKFLLELVYDQKRFVILYSIQLVEKMGAVVYTLVHVWVDLKDTNAPLLPPDFTSMAITRVLHAERLVSGSSIIHHEIRGQQLFQWKDK